MFKSTLIFILFALLCALFALFSAPALAAAREGFYLWRDSVFPALLPFFICTYIMQSCGAVSGRSRTALYALSMVSGAPAGARLAGYGGGDVTDTAAALNAASPMFVIGSFAHSMLGRPALAWPILIAQSVSAGVFLLLARDNAKAPPPSPLAAEEPLPFGSLFSKATASGVSALFTVGGTIMFFMAFKAVLDETGLFSFLIAPLNWLLTKFGQPPELGSILVTGLLEMVQGCKELASAGLSMRQTAAWGAFFFSFGGLCVLAQSLAFAKIRAGRYLMRKLLQGCLAGLLAYLIAPLFLPDSQAVFAALPPEALRQNALSAALVAGISLTGVSAVLLLAAAAGRRQSLPNK